jgi:hypothetical protein
MARAMRDSYGLAARAVAAAIFVGSVNRTGTRVPRIRKKVRGVFVSARTKKAVVIAPQTIPLLTFSWTRLFSKAAAAVLLVTDTIVSSPQLALAGLVLLDEFRSFAATSLDESDGAIIYALHLRGGSAIVQPEDLLLAEVNRHLQGIREKPMRIAELRSRLQKLARLGTVERTVVVGWRLLDRVWLVGA